MELDTRARARTACLKRPLGSATDTPASGGGHGWLWAASGAAAVPFRTPKSSRGTGSSLGQSRGFRRLSTAGPSRCASTSAPRSRSRASLPRVLPRGRRQLTRHARLTRYGQSNRRSGCRRRRRRLSRDLAWLNAPTTHRPARPSARRMARDQLSNGPVAHGRPPRARASQGSVSWRRRSRHDLHPAASPCHRPAAPRPRPAARAAGRPTTRH